MTISLVAGQLGTATSASTTSLAVTVPSGITLGNLVVAELAFGGGATGFTGPSGWAQGGAGAVSSGGVVACQVWYLVVDAGHAGQTSFTFSWSGGGNGPAAYCVREWNSTTGWQASPVDQASAGNTSGTTVATGSTGTTAQASELWVAALCWGDTGQSESGLTAAFTSGQLATVAGASCREAYYVASATGAAACQETIGTFEQTAAQIVTFMPAAGGAVTVPQPPAQAQRTYLRRQQPQPPYPAAPPAPPPVPQPATIAQRTYLRRTWPPQPVQPPAAAAAVPAPSWRPQPRRPGPARARIGPALAAAGLIGTIGVAGTPPRPFPASHPQPHRAVTGPLGRNAAGQGATVNHGYAPPPQPRPPRIVRPPQRALQRGQAGPPNHGQGQTPPSGLPRIPHPAAVRVTWRGAAGPVNHGYAPPPGWHPQPRRPGPVRAIGKGQPGGANQTVFYVPVGPPPYQPHAWNVRKLQRALWRGVAGPQNHGAAQPPPGLPKRIVRPLQRALQRGVAGPVNHGYAPPPGVQPQIRHPQPQRALWRGQAAPPPRPGPARQQFTQPRRPAPLRAVWRGSAVRAAQPGTAVPAPRLLRQPPRRVQVLRAIWRVIHGAVAPPPPAPLLDPSLLAGTIAADITAGTITSDNVTGVITADRTGGVIT